MTTDLSQKTAIVTGGTSGIGKAIVTAFREAGAEVIFTGRDDVRGAEVADTTGGYFLKIDATSADQANSIVDAALKHTGRIDIVVSNAGGFGAPQGVETMTEDALDETLAVHLRAPWNLMVKVAPEMRKQGGGSIINMASVAGQRVGASSAAYSVTKAALLHLTRCAAAEFGTDNIRVNSISPGFVATGIHASSIEGDDARRDKFVEGLGRVFLRRQALPHLGKAGDIASLALYLASDDAAFVTGADFVADGGLMWGQHGLI